MVHIKDEGIILKPTNLPFESEAVFNPGCIEVDGIVHMFYRAVRPGNYSTIGYCQLKDNKVIRRFDHPVLVPEHDYEKHGLEDPRIVFLNGIYYLFYTAYDGKNALGAYATSKDLVHFTKRGIITPKIPYKDVMETIKRNKHLHRRYAHYADRVIRYSGQDALLWDKDVFIFPKIINNSFWLAHRIMPGIQIATFKDFSELTPEYWRDYLKTFEQHILFDPQYRFENHKIGGGCPPIETEAGWLFIYHSVGRRYVRKRYYAAAALLDRDNPKKVIARLPYPLFSPSSAWEQKGIVQNVVFPTSALIHNDRLNIYYGAADSCIGLKSVLLSDLISELQRHPVDR
jgi:predicted GH43/DUF377 family glycosyl hydrolase